MNTVQNRCGMQPRELLKLAVSGYFQVLKISKGSDGLYVLKRMCQYLYPAWEKISSSADRKDLQFDIELFSNKSMVLVASEKLSQKDLLVKEYVQESRSWRILERFKSVNQSESWLASELYDHMTVLVN